ncbi:hypothetical protein FRC02_000421 [Tulasnella sp. 418]|nr:hypothetical protein FRC02_000421 [Tulasnella sp. 418]
MSTAEVLDLDESKLSGDNGDLYLFQWLTSTEATINSLPVDTLKSCQSTVESVMVKAITGVSPFPSPGRPIRNSVARCLINIYSRGETKTRFDVMQSFIKTASDPKASTDIVRVACLYCIAEIMAEFGSQIMSLMNEIANLGLRILKSSSNAVILRYHALRALSKSLSSAGRAVTEPIAKDILKQTRNALSDKALPIQRAAADALVIQYSEAESVKTLADVQAIVNTCVKALETADDPSRRAISRLVAQVLSLTQVAKVAPVVDTSKKSKDEGDDQEEGVTQAGAEPSKPMLTITEMLSILSTTFNNPIASRKVRTGIFDFYITLLTQLGPSFVEPNYAVIVQHLMSEIVSPYRNSSTAYEVLFVRKLVGILLRDLIGDRMLSEQGQIGAIRELSSSYLKKWPSLMPGKSPPSHLILVVALKEVSGLLQQLGNAPPPVQEALEDPLIQLLSHPNTATQAAAAWCLRCFCFSTPLRLPKAVISVIELLQRDITSMETASAPPEVGRRAIGHAYGLAALFAVIPERPLYVSYDMSIKVLDMATQLLKRAGEHDLAVAGVEVEVAWTCISSLMALGPNFVRSHLPQLLVLWRNALPKPLSKDTNAAGRSIGEWTFLLQVREAALGAILSFLRHNSPTLVTLDVARRLASLLSNALAFSSAFVLQQNEDLQDITGVNPLNPGVGPSLAVRDAMLKRRIYQCFVALGFSSITESLQSTLIQSVIGLFASPEGYVGSGIQAAIATSSGSISSIWNVSDGYAYGLSSLGIQGSTIENDHGDGVSDEKKEKLNRDILETLIDSLAITPIVGSCEHDMIVLCRSRSQPLTQSWPEPPPPSTGVVDAAIELFSLLLPLQDAPTVARNIAQLTQHIRSPKLDRNIGRKSAATYNSTMALMLMLKNGVQTRLSKDVISSSQVTNALTEILKDGLFDGDSELRAVASEALGGLANFAGTTFLSSQVKFLVDQVLTNRDPHGRAGCASAFGSIYKQVGGLAAGPLLKTTINVLMSLGNDPHPVVHYYALSALGDVINAASLSFAPFISNTIGMLFRLYMMETHEPEGGSIFNVNVSGSLPTYHVVCQIIDAVIAVLGPELRESAKTRKLLLDLVTEFSKEEDEGIRVEAIKCMQHFLMFGAEFIDIPELVKGFRKYLSSSRRPLKTASVNALYQLVQRDSFMMSKVGGDSLVEDLFGMLDDDPTIEGVRNIISSWLQQTVVHNPSAWIDLCQRIMARTTASQQATDAASKNAGFQDDEAESLNVGLGGASTSSRGNLTSRWRTQLFALQCLHQICVLVGQSGRREHLDLVLARNQKIPLSGLLVSRVPDLIRMAFTASAAYVTEIRLEGLVVLRDVIEIFANSPDPEYEDALLLEQHQAPITAALTPAFSSDSTPEILASAIQACAIFVGCGVVKDVGRMGRILKLLTSALEQSKESGQLSIGDVGELSPNASVMLRVSTLTAWADLQVASRHQSYLQEVLQPYRAILATLWVATLRDYASVRADSEVLQDSSSMALNASYSGMGREILLPYYESSWWKILKAIGTAMDTNDQFVVAAMDGREGSDKSITTKALRDDPTVYFHVLFGLAYEALVSYADVAPSAPRNDIVLSSLEALKSLVKPEYAGKAIFEPVVFDEFRSLAFRMAVVETPLVQIELVNVVSSLAISQSTRFEVELADSGFPPDLPLTHCLRICAYVLRQGIPKRGVSRDIATPAERVSLLLTAFRALAAIGQTFGPSRNEDVRAIAISLYSELLKDETSGADLCGPTLPALKSILDVTTPLEGDAVEKYGKLIHGLLSSCLQNIEEMRGREGPSAAMKIKNNLLVTVLILTSTPEKVQLSQAAVDQCCYLISLKLEEVNEISLTAAHCAKTIILAASSGVPILRYCIKLLMPGMISYIGNVASLGDEDPNREVHNHGVEEIMKSFAAFFNTVPEEHRVRLLGVLLPVSVLLLDPSRSPPSPGHMRVLSHLLAFATSSPASFKEATAKLDTAVRETLEVSLRQALGSRANATPQMPTKPQISLRTF